MQDTALLTITSFCTAGLVKVHVISQTKFGRSQRAKEGDQDRGRGCHRIRGKSGPSAGLEEVETPKGRLEARLAATLAELSG